jgi:hypothetical protein
VFSRWRLDFAVASAAIAVAFAGCGSEPAAVQRETRDDKPVAAADRVSESPVRSSGASALKRRDLPPEGVERQVSFGAAGDSICGRPAKRPKVVFDRRGFPPPAEGVDGGFPPLSEYDEPEIGERFWICPAGFDLARPLRIAVTDPTGKTQTRDIPAPADPGGLREFWDWQPRPGDPLGEYEVRASQGAIAARRTFRLHAASAPNISTLTSARGTAPGEDVQVMVFGFKPHERVHLNIYAGSAAAEYSYRASVPVRVGADGATIAAVPTAADDPPTCGVARVEIAAGPLDTFFCVEPR